MEKLYLIDTTLRDGEQTPGVVFNIHEKIKIAYLLDKIGFNEVEIGTPAMGYKEVSDIKTIIAEGFNFKTLSWCRAIITDINKARLAGTTGIHISFPVSEIHLNSMGKNKSWVLKTLHETVMYAKNYFEYVSVGAQDASRAEMSFLLEFVYNAYNLGVSRVRIADTVGILNPFSTFDLIHSVHTEFPELPIEFHGHNDLGMATANTLAAFKAGSTCASVTVNGIGERAGNCSFEQIIIALELSSNILLRMDTTLISELSELVSSITNIPIISNKPVVGKHVLIHETGIHTNLLLKNRETYQIIQASRIGKNEKEFVIGKHSGKSSIINFFKKYNVNVTDKECDFLVEKIKEKSFILKRSLSNNEILDMYSLELVK